MSPKGIREKVLPSQLTHLEFGYFFDQSIYKCIPETVKYLKFGNKISEYIFNLQFDDSIHDYIPKNIEYLSFDQVVQHKINKIRNIDILFPNLKQFICGSINIIVDNTKNISTFEYIKNKLFNIVSLFNPFNSFNQTTDEIKELILKPGKEIINSISSTIKILYIVQYYHPICKILPPNIKCLYIYNFYGTIEKQLPSTLKYMVICNYFNQPIKDLLPEKIKYLVLGSDFNQSLKDCLPKSLKYLGISRECYELNKEYIDDNIYVEFICDININNSSSFNFKMIM
ncbi:FNIP repeat-containing protein [Acanthamoeba polyphaga moumouvirus]|uniref:FNIP repeat-containing protein n=1 Tax=Acanthamoeba polyphaga moumouvirus TaxID=1269028 RepID=L7RE34_9VIRU|nr:FNIP repeat-containing protein [Acanthamoeba polyphaga moumouvirus]AGC02383.1 FNIP repeat-containing protein [Acanthamoeba polyphaga moumouvirus]